MIKEISNNRKLKKVTMAAAVVGMGIGLATVLTSFDDSGGGGSGSGAGCATTSVMYTHHKTQDKALQVTCYTCTSVIASASAVVDSNNVVIGFNVTYKRIKTSVTRRDCKSSPNDYDSCNEISLTNPDPNCTVFQPGPGGSGAGL